ncbi:MAG: histidine kinase [Geobacter sp.]|nr:MAG: histidine kinase [Geobacter sp.]
MRSYFRYSIRLKLTAATLVPLMTAIALCWVIGASIITDRIFSQAQQAVETDLNSAHEIFLGELNHLTDNARSTGQSPDLAIALRDNTPLQAVPSLQVIIRNEQLSFLTITDRFGMVRYRATNPNVTGDTLANDKLIKDAMAGAIASGLTLLSPEQAGQENPRLPQEMTIAVKATPHARLYSTKAEQRGMFLVAAAPVKSASGELCGVVYAGQLLNGDNSLVDRITRVIFRQKNTAAAATGGATLFLNDVRIATSVLDENKQRAIGTLMSEEVYDSVSKGEKWIGRAFVLNDWHFSAYEPVRDYRGSVIGALYVGTPEKPYLLIRSHFDMIFTGVLIFVTLIGVSLSAWLATSLASPIRMLEDAARRLAAGEQPPDIVVGGHDEISLMAEEFNIMKHRLIEREEENLALNRTLEQKVIERTNQLEVKSEQLLAAQKELAHSERLAGIGMLASGVAHEINNPLAIIRGNAELLEMMDDSDSDRSEEVETIIKQATRIERIVRNLLTFSRSSIKRVTSFSLVGLLDDILDQIGHQIPLEGYTIERHYTDAGIATEGDQDQLRQVFTNLVLNGLQAMKDGGLLVVDAALDQAADLCFVTITDNGPGIEPALQEKLFTPFFTTKDEGTGLGLAISYGIVRDHCGEIRVQSEPGKGTTFTVILPVRQGA